MPKGVDFRYRCDHCERTLAASCPLEGNNTICEQCGGTLVAFPPERYDTDTAPEEEGPCSDEDRRNHSKGLNSQASVRRQRTGTEDHTFWSSLWASFGVMALLGVLILYFNGQAAERAAGMRFLRGGDKNADDLRQLLSTVAWLVWFCFGAICWVGIRLGAITRELRRQRDKPAAD